MKCSYSFECVTCKTLINLCLSVTSFRGILSAEMGRIGRECDKKIQLLILKLHIYRYVMIIFALLQDMFTHTVSVKSFPEQICYLCVWKNN